MGAHDEYIGEKRKKGTPKTKQYNLAVTGAPRPP